MKDKTTQELFDLVRHYESEITQLQEKVDDHTAKYNTLLNDKEDRDVYGETDSEDYAKLLDQMRHHKTNSKVVNRRIGKLRGDLADVNRELRARRHASGGKLLDKKAARPIPVMPAKIKEILDLMDSADYDMARAHLEDILK